GNLVDLLFQLGGNRNVHIVDVQDDVAVVGNDPFPINRIAAQFHQLPGHMTAGHGDHFHGQRETSQHTYQLAFIRNTDKGFGHRRHDFFTGQGRTTALDELQALVGLVGTINVKLQLRHAVQVVYRNAVLLQALGGGFGTGDGTVEMGFQGSQGVNKHIGGGAGAYTDNAFVGQAGFDMGDGGLGNRFLESVLGHC